MKSPEEQRAARREAQRRARARDPAKYRARSLAWYYANRTPRTDEQRAYQREWARAKYAKDPERFRAEVRQRQARQREWWESYKATLDMTCQRCGESHPALVNFHHVDPQTKRFQISSAANHSRAEILAELAKCVVLCARCHALHHWEERRG